MNTLIDKIWESHTIETIDGGPTQLYIDRHYCHEVTSPQAFEALRQRGLNVLRPAQTTAMPDHNIPTHDQDKPIIDPSSRIPVETLYNNAEQYGIEIYKIGDPRNGIIHVVGPEQGLTLPGMTIVCGDSHTSTHGAMGAVAFGIGTSEVEMVLASQCILQQRPKTMRINVEGQLGKGVTAKDIALYLIAQLGTAGATGYFVEYAGEAIRNLSMEGRMTLCNMSIEMGARGGLVAPDETTFEYIRPRFKGSDAEFEAAVEKWRKLPSGPDAVFDKELTFNAADIEPRVTYGTNPGMGIAVTGNIPADATEYMKLPAGKPIAGTKVDYVFLGSCTNGRIEDFRAFASIVEGRKKHPDVVAWLVPGSQQVARQIEAEGIGDRLRAAGFEIRQPGCSACLAMNDDKVPEGKLCVSTSNRNFEGRQGQGARTVLASPLTAAAAAVTGVITDTRTFI
ncbi:MAG: 3-isopropylmalate dehydratase large subunit [Muribaculaceae bacterium]|nr:3-isopropylmalate dehydratase large subunit [Muribaculaceae bacterium]